MRMIFNYIRPYLLRMSIGLSIKFFGTILDLLLPWLLAYMIDDVVPLGKTSLVWFNGGLMVLCSIAAVVTNIIANRMASRVARDTTETIRHDLFAKITYLSCHQADTFTVPSLVSRLTSDTYNIHQMVGMMQRLGVRAPILLIGGLAITMTLEPVLSLTLLVILPFITVLVLYVSKKGIPLYASLQRAVDSLVRTVQENVTGIRVIKALSKTEYEKTRFHDVNAQVADRDAKAGTVMAITNPVMNLFLNIGLTLVIIVGAYRVNLGLTQPGKIIAFLTYFTIILNAMMMITRIFVMYSKGAASANRINDVLISPEELALAAGQAAESEYHISFENVSFSYDGRQDNIKALSFGLRRGETLGIIGPTGSGKTTVIQLLLRFYDPDSGEIRINGEDIRSIPALHDKFGVALQNDILLADTVAENISLGRGLSMDEIKKAAGSAQAAEFIDGLEGGYDFRLAIKGANLSGGQKQRMLISRALAGSPEILILDDSSSALDYKTDLKLRNALNESYGNTTTIIVAQRISSIMNADLILVLENGLITGGGTHDELMASCEAYRVISGTQMGDGNLE